MSLFRKKTLSILLAQAADSEKGLKRTLGAWSLIALGIGAIIGAGLFVRTAAAAGGNNFDQRTHEAEPAPASPISDEDIPF